MSTASSAESSRRALVVYDAVRDPHVLAELLVDVLGLMPTDALIHARHAPGVLPDRIEPALADQLIERLKANGVGAAAVDPTELIDFHHPHVVHHVHLLKEGIEILTERGTADGLVPWDRIAVISAGQVPLESAQRYDWNDEHLFATARRSHHEPHRAKLPPVMELWLIDGNDPRPFRIDQTRMNYETLGAGKVDSAAENFGVLLRRIVERAAQAYVTPSTRAYLDRASALKYTFTSTEELQHVTQWQALLAKRADD